MRHRLKAQPTLPLTRKGTQGLDRIDVSTKLWDPKLSHRGRMGLLPLSISHSLALISSHLSSALVGSSPSPATPLQAPPSFLCIDPKRKRPIGLILTLLGGCLPTGQPCHAQGSHWLPHLLPSRTSTASGDPELLSGPTNQSASTQNHL